MELTRLASHAHRAQRVASLTKRDSEVPEILREDRSAPTANHELHFKRADCPFHDPSYPACNDKQVTEYHRKCDEYLDNLLYHPGDVLGHAIKCIFKSIGGETGCWKQYHEAASYFDSPKDFVLKFIKWHMKKASFTMEVMEQIDVLVHPQIEFDLTAGMWFGKSPDRTRHGGPDTC